MDLYIDISSPHKIESANYVTNVEPALHPDRIMDIHDFLYIIDGSWEIYENDTAYYLENDDLLLLTAGSHHYGKIPSSAGNRHMYIHLYTEHSAKNDNQIKLNTLYHCSGNPKIKQYFSEIISTYWGTDSQKETKLSLLFGLLLCELNALSDIKTSVNKYSETISKVLNLMQSNPHTLYSCQEMADNFFICSRTLSNMFMQTYGVSFYSYQMNMKLEMVRQYLADHPDELLINVAKNFGFYDEFHLSKSYKKMFGIPPKRSVSLSRH